MWNDADTSVIETTYDPAPKGSPAVYRYLIGDAPRCEADDRMTARAYLAKIEAALRQGVWGKVEDSNLRHLWAKWRARATGEDISFRLHGNRPGARTKQERSRTRDLAALLYPPRFSLARPAYQLPKAATPTSQRAKHTRIPHGKGYHDMTWDEIMALHA